MANSVPYGYYPGLTLIVPTSPGHLILTANQFRLSLSAFLVPVAILIGIFERWRGHWRSPAYELLIVLAAAMLLTAYPRWDVNGLLNVTPPAWALITLWAIGRIPIRIRLPLTAGFVSAAALFFFLLLSRVDDFTYFTTRAGRLRHTADSGLALEGIEKHIPAGASCFVYPYRPILGWILNTRNPTTYSYLQPGMMLGEDERRALQQLQADPPRFVLWQKLPLAQILTVWPNSDPTFFQFHAIEAFLIANYREVGQYTATNFSIRVLEHQPVLQ